MKHRVNFVVIGTREIDEHMQKYAWIYHNNKPLSQRGFGVKAYNNLTTSSARRLVNVMRAGGWKCDNNLLGAYWQR